MGDILEKGDENMANDDWDIFDKEINRSIETARKTMDLCIEPYIKELAIYKRALELACEDNKRAYELQYLKNDVNIGSVDAFKSEYLRKAKEELEE